MREASNNVAHHRYELVVDNWTAYVTYERKGNRIVLLHTLVPAALEGKGVGTALARSTLEQIRRQGLLVAPECPFIAGFIKRHPEFQDIVGPPESNPL
ncbi:MAG: GNAT family N-acetyltransferase [Acetobacteraceae bacterium]|nr:GNAT family N-acetyltransferase [Acetobacteraceae bacterium]